MALTRAVLPFFTPKPYCSPVEKFAATSKPSLMKGESVATSLTTASTWPVWRAWTWAPRSSKTTLCRPFSSAQAAPVVATWTAMVLPSRDSRVERSEPSATRRPWSASKYGSEKSMLALRSSVMVIPEATMSHWPALRAAPDSMPSKPVASGASSRSRSAATSPTRAMSKPTISPSFSSSKGSKGGLVQTVSLPDAMVAIEPSAAVPSELASSEDEHPARRRPPRATRAAALRAVFMGHLRGRVVEYSCPMIHIHSGSCARTQAAEPTVTDVTAA